MSTPSPIGKLGPTVPSFSIRKSRAVPTPATCAVTGVAIDDETESAGGAGAAGAAGATGMRIPFGTRTSGTAARGGADERRVLGAGGTVAPLAGEGAELRGLAGASWLGSV